MKRKLRHPITSIREPFGTAGLIVAMIALVAALGGTALAAAKLNSTQKKEVEKIAKKYAGKPGANGTNGTNGSPGAAGKDGTNGTNGAAGQSVTGTEFAGAEGTCTEGGVKFASASGTAYACNGKKGNTGTAGHTPVGTSFAGNEHGCTEGGVEFTITGGTTTYACNGVKGTTGFTSTLPAGKTETGTYVLNEHGFPAETEKPLIAISFPIPLAAGSGNAFFFDAPETEEINEGTATFPTHGCTGDEGIPKAPSGTLCVYADEQEPQFQPTPGNIQFSNFITFGYQQAGTLLYFFNHEATSQSLEMRGSWAVTG